MLRFGVRLRSRFRRELWSWRSPRWLQKASAQGLAVSLLFHLALLVFAAVSFLPAVRPSMDFVLDTSWIDPSESGAQAIEVVVGEAAAPSHNDGGSTGGFLPEFRSNNPVIENPVQSAIDFPWDSSAETNLGQFVGQSGGAPNLPRGFGSGRGKGPGIGDGTGHGRQGGNGKSFFGVGSEAKSVVYVLDCSLSMNHPHDSDAKTRFKRMKMELTNSVLHLRPDQEFFIIFFNHEAIPMPSDRLVAATPENLQHYLTWMEQVPAFGDTDPTSALKLALRLQPDVIYFLTDGCFSSEANDIVRAIQQNRTVIHTFAFEPWLTDKQRAGLELLRQKKASAAMLKLGEATYRRTRELLVAEEVLHGLAKHNGGQYHVIP